ncbi:SDR family oxidoreductase [Trinickia fusca]|uniref:SDR family oxidoreductase n=1 Tax=Trinickia fusca TaxID=2419777 RepID=A0A494XBP6_9BURK|nr:SDR family oxidoreductase [Trinickia fusca]RKP45916.1 SDR family oxidoreductase [Trinickia fusca]
MTTSSASPLKAKAIVTGHTRGLGAALAETLLARGFAVLGVSRTRHASLASRFGGALEEAEVDLADSGQLAQWLAGECLPRFLRDTQQALLINNAGTVQPVGPGSTQASVDVARAVALNVGAPLMFASAFATASTHVPDRRIAHVSSGAARSAYAGWSVYCATKAALDHHARAVALDNEPGLRIASVAPGVIDTDMQAEIRGTDEARFPLRERFTQLKADGQLSTPADAAHKFVDYLLSDAFGQTAAADVRMLGQ